MARKNVGPPKPKSGFEKHVAKYAERVLTTTLLAIDPSSSSRGSQPGYAFFRGGVMQEAGVFEIPPGMALNRKLHRLVTDLRSSFTEVDVLVLEYISPFFANRGFNKSNMSLQRACGAVQGAVESEICIEVPPMTWHQYKPEGYEKSDMGDAILQGETVLITAEKLLGIEWRDRQRRCHEYLAKFRSERG